METDTDTDKDKDTDTKRILKQQQQQQHDHMNMQQPPLFFYFNSYHKWIQSTLSLNKKEKKEGKETNNR